jgi:hypothetical protein
MTHSTTPSASKSPSRRALLAGSLGGLGALVANAVGRGIPARAADGEAVVVGGEYTATSVTKFSNLTTSDAVLWGESSQSLGVKGSSVSSVGVSGESTNHAGVSGTSGSFIGVQGSSSSGRGVYGSSTSNFGVQGVSSDAGRAGTVGHGFGDGTGVLGVSGLVALSAKAKTGVYGYAAQDGTSKGVWGTSPAGHAIHGESDSGWAGFFDGKVFTNRFLEFKEISTPGAPDANRAKIFARDNGSGRTQLCVRFSNGTIRVLATA